MVNWELRKERVGRGYSSRQMADILGMKSVQSYLNKERCQYDFSRKQMLIISKLFQLSPEDFNRIFFEGQLPFG